MTCRSKLNRVIPVAEMNSIESLREQWRGNRRARTGSKLLLVFGAGIVGLVLFLLTQTTLPFYDLF